ncbi:hypothetical protein J8281_06060 [Aquimarina sp. U1-2]|uniref:hypothetical protein n=1 Tax=Aquimarina sp. U1-2 TaxID=2823141 RepID=UPI001AECD965|nr:hypothetical protein [Aquimarina sp. U1-2]MBP2831748.1 hypothetical protein [Aquimarina sp. U1-2]
MERTPEIFEKIEAYLNNTLSQDEVLAFEKEIANTVELQNEVEKHRSLHQTLSDRDTLKFKEKLVTISKKIKKEEEHSASQPFFSSNWRIAASIVIILGIASFFWYTFDSQNRTQELYATYYQPFPAEDITRGKPITELQDVVSSYVNQNYTRVIEALENKANINDQYKLYLGNSYMNTNTEQKAILLFESIPEDSPYYENSRWYLLLTYLKLGKIQKMKPLLNAIIQYNGLYKKDAIRLKEALLD